MSARRVLFVGWVAVIVFLLGAVLAVGPDGSASVIIGAVIIAAITVFTASTVAAYQAGKGTR